MKGFGLARHQRKSTNKGWKKGLTKQNKKWKERSIKGCGMYRKVTSHWYRGGAEAWACQEERAEGNLKTEKNLCREYDMLVEDREKRQYAECRD